MPVAPPKARLASPYAALLVGAIAGAMAAVGCGGLRGSTPTSRARLDLPVAADAKPGCSFALRAQLAAVLWPVGAVAPGSPLRIVLRAEAPEMGGARLRYTGSIVAPQIVELGWSRLRVGLTEAQTQTPEWTSSADSDPARVTGETLLLDGSGTIEPALARGIVLSPEEYRFTMEARTSEGGVRFEGPLDLDPPGSPPTTETVERCF